MTKSRTRQIAEKTIFAAFNILQEAGGELRGKEVIDKIRETIQFDEYEKHVHEKTGYVRWESILHFYTIHCMKAGFLRKNKGLWILTHEGAEAIKLGPEVFLNNTKKIYLQWKAQRKIENQVAEIDDIAIDEVDLDIDQAQKALLNQYEEKANSGIRDFINNKNPYEFQDLVAALLNAMGYHISHIAERGPDGGIDIIAYTDPLGTKQPRIIVQVKHRPTNSVSSEDIQKLSGTLKRNSDVGIFVTSGLFTKSAKKEALNSREHIELIDFDRLIELWQEYYPKMSDLDKNFLPLHTIYFLGSNE
ncbi:TPA: restriction endonuclease [Legionella pneumophila]|nr:Mrr restriction system protein [Legionella pneumophila]HAU0872185.1 Mrr restriction system protein [Legionella pneumophila]HAU0890361.1 Mrr restriction system protein [Legionella pneumophila]HCD9489742.1 restriction endonuclease [Legionella pneumophila]HCD9495332.1 restriction endonuclease [Legionella pneumophila]